MSAPPRTPSRPVLTYLLIAVNLAMFAVQHLVSGAYAELVLWPPAVAHGQYLRLATSAFLHAGVLHLLFNMWALFVVGPPLERLLGRARYAMVYALSALGGSVLAYACAPLNSATLGASGAIFGLFGATFVLARRMRAEVGGVVALIAVNLVITFVVPGVSWQGHLGGLVTGTLVTWSLPAAPGRAGPARDLAIPAAVVVLLVAAVWWRSRQVGM